MIYITKDFHLNKFHISSHQMISEHEIYCFQKYSSLHEFWKYVTTIEPKRWSILLYEYQLIHQSDNKIEVCDLFGWMTESTYLFFESLDTLTVSSLSGLQSALCLDLSCAETLCLHLCLGTMSGRQVDQSSNENTVTMVYICLFSVLLISK